MGLEGFDKRAKPRLCKYLYVTTYLALVKPYHIMWGIEQVQAQSTTCPAWKMWKNIKLLEDVIKQLLYAQFSCSALQLTPL